MSVVTFTTDYQDELYRFEHILLYLNNVTYLRELCFYYEEHTKNYKKIIQIYLQALELDKNNDTLYRDIGWNLYYDKKYEESILYFLKAAELNKEYPRLYFLIGNSYVGLKDYQNAVKFYLKAIRSEKQYIEIDYYDGLADCYVLMGDYKKAIKTIMCEIKRQPASIGLMFRLARIYAKCDYKDLAFIWLEYSLANRKEMTKHLIKSDKVFKKYKKDEDFKALLKKYA
jgi:tetratricopeptide (TPR) repeat protein